MFKNGKRLLLLLALVGAVAVAVLAACAAPTEKVAAPGEGSPIVLPTATPLGAEVKPIPGGTYRGTFGSDPPYWDPNRGTSGEAHSALNMVHSTLFQYHFGPEYPIWNFDIDTKNGLVESWEMSADGLTWTLHLRKGVKWQNKPPLNGREWVSSDVKWTIELHRDTAGAPRREWMQVVESVECPDKYTAVFKLKERRAEFLIMMANPYVEMLAPELLEHFGTLNKPEAVIGLGPWILEENVINVRRVYKKNPDYYRANEGLPYMDTMHYTCITDSSTSLAAFRAEKTDIRGISRIDLASVKETNPNIYCYEREVGATHKALTFRTDRTPFNDPKVRQAISMAIDRQLIIDSSYLGYGIVQKGPIHAASPWYLEDQGECEKYYDYNPEEAKRLLAEAGYPAGFDVTLNVCTPWMGDTEDLIVDFLSKIGITATMKPSELAAHYQNRLCGYEGMVITYEWGAATIGPDSWLVGIYLPKGGSHFGCVDDPKLTEMILAQQVEMDPVKRQQILDEIQRYCACQMYFIQWPMGYGVTCHQPWVRNYQTHAAAYHSGKITEIVWVTEDAPGRKM